MTKELTKIFFDTFGIEPRHTCIDGALEPCDEQCNECGYYELRYPQITDRILLELICIICPYGAVLARDVEYLKQQTLQNCINLYEQIDIKQQVQALFEET